MDLNLEDVKVLVVDDSPFMRKVVMTILYVFHCNNVKEADDGASGLKIISEGYMPDLIITDWKMPHLDGIEFTREIRRGIDGIDPYLPIILMTAYTETSHITQCRDAGVNEILAKPLSAKGLYQRIVSVFTKPRAFVESRAFTGPDRRRRKLPGKLKGEDRRKNRGTKADREPPDSPESGAGENEDGNSTAAPAA